LLDAPMFMARWRWTAGVSLALPRFRGGKKVAPQLARMEAEDLVATVFPDHLACAENIVGDREIPDHPLTNQTIADCLHEAMDIAGLERVLARLESGAMRVVARDLTQPSPLALEVLSARPYAYLDDAPLEERRTQAVMARRWLAPESADELGRLDADAIARVRLEAWPDPANAEELHDALLWLGCLTAEEAASVPEWSGWLAEMARGNRVVALPAPHATLWVAAERAQQFRALWPDAAEPGSADAGSVKAGPEKAGPVEAGVVETDAAGGAASAAALLAPASRESALVEILRGRLEGLGPVTPAALATPLGLEPDDIAPALIALEAEGFVLRGRFTPGANTDEWCDRRLLARIHHYTVRRLRAEIEPVAARDFLRFLCAWHHLRPDTRLEGPESVTAAAALLEGFETPAGAWETELFPARIADYEPAWLDDACLAGRLAWGRLTPGRGGNGDRAASPLRTTPVSVLPRRHVAVWTSLAGAGDGTLPGLRAQAVLEALRQHGASFFDELVDATSLLRQQVEEALAELVTFGLVTSDSFGGLRALLVPSDRRKPFSGGPRRRRTLSFGMEDAGRWAPLRRPAPADAPPASVEHVARALLRRYGVVFWRLLAREASWLPPWRDLLRVYRRLEARGEIRGGRFVAGFSGEQYALPDAVGTLRELRRQPHDGAFVSVSGADPLNLAGILTPGARLPAITRNRLLLRDGLPVASLAGGDVQFLTVLDAAAQWQARKLLLRSAAPAMLADLA